ncbi:hypothetical protein U724_00035 [Pseudomonas chlororaphis subsp. aurantiaca PB-St2]|nr:hypothetical protein U724_00035 [Pseudomonas chlororaphis subsp. aurantiaca PB-St2]
MTDEPLAAVFSVAAGADKLPGACFVLVLEVHA